MIPDVSEVFGSLWISLKPSRSKALTTPSPRIGTSLLQQVVPQPLHSHPPRQAEVEGLGHLPHLPPLRMCQGLGIRDTQYRRSRLPVGVPPLLPELQEG